ncbi:MAG: multidrug transporter, partial [Treponema sp.]|nr:multidrug transporter [Treponema sp.]
TSKDIIAESAVYIRIESVANIFSLLGSFMLVCLVTLGKSRYVYILTAAKLVLSIVFDTFFVSTLKISANLGVNGIGLSNIIVNIILMILSILLLSREGCKIFSREKLSFKWARDFIKIGGISGLESFVRNIAYMLMISRMVNMANEQGTYWVANNFIWGWLLLPINQLGELIKQEVGTNEKAVKNNTLGYLALTVIVCLVWFVTIPLWKPFMKNVLQFSDVEKLFNLVMLLLGFYVLYALQNVFDCEFYGLGKTNYMLFESVVTNMIYYGTAFILYLIGTWTPTLTGIALLFGIGNAFDSIVSVGAFAFLLKKKGINILEVEQS